MHDVNSRTMVLDGREVRYGVRLSRRAKRWSLIVSPEEGLLLVLPVRQGNADADGIIGTRRRWVLKHLERLEATRARTQGPLLDTQSVVFMGSTLRLDLRPTPTGAASVAIEAGSLVITHQPAESPRQVALPWLRKHAARLLSLRAGELAERHGYRFTHLGVRDQRSRWGSCHKLTGRMTLNWRLSFAPLEVLDYVIYHELAHLRHSDHSRRFWAAVAQLDPAYLRHRRWLRRHGDLLRLDVFAATMAFSCGCC
ncbi:MAG: SprT family zinc-dependent metalloprotease [Elusimicrobiota bacterium]